MQGSTLSGVRIVGIDVHMARRYRNGPSLRPRKALEFVDTLGAMVSRWNISNGRGLGIVTGTRNRHRCGITCTAVFMARRRR